MPPIVEAAVISGCFGLLGLGGTVWVAITGFRANRRIANESAQAERSRNLWEKRCAAYEEIIGILHDRQAYQARIAQMAQAAKTGAVDYASFPPIAMKYAEDFHDPDTRGVRSRLLAYATPEVRTAYWQMVVDEMAAGLTLVTWAGRLQLQQLLAAGQGGDSLADPKADPEQYWSKYKELSKVAQARDKALTDLIRRDLGSDPPLKSLPQPWPGLMAPPSQGQDGERPQARGHL